MDPVGQVLVITLLASLTYAIIEGGRAGWLTAEILGLFALSACALAALIAYERSRPEPLIELRFFRSVPFSGASAIAVLSFAALGGFLFLNTLYLQKVGLSALDAGLYTLPIAAMTFIFAPISGRIVGRRGPRVGLIVGGRRDRARGRVDEQHRRNTAVGSLLPAYFVFGVGFGMVNPPITNTAVLGMPAAQAGLAAAVASTSRQVGQTLGVAVSARSQLRARARSARGSCPRATPAGGSSLRAAWRARAGPREHDRACARDSEPRRGGSRSATRRCARRGGRARGSVRQRRAPGGSAMGPSSALERAVRRAGNALLAQLPARPWRWRLHPFQEGYERFDERVRGVRAVGVVVRVAVFLVDQRHVFHRDF